MPGGAAGQVRIGSCASSGAAAWARSTWRSARTRQFRKRVAIKLVKRGMDDRAVRRAASATSARSSPASSIRNIARLLDGGTTDDGLPYFVMEYVEGEPIDRVLRRTHGSTSPSACGCSAGLRGRAVRAPAT